MDLNKYFKNKIGGKTFFITGDTGFKGNWMSHFILFFGGQVYGYSDENKFREYFPFISKNKRYNGFENDIRDLSSLKKNLQTSNVDYLIHMAAQPLVQESFKNPYETYTVNFVGTLNVLELLREFTSIKSSLIITTDKVYRNDEIKDYRYKEEDVIFGKDPYSNSKSTCELVYKTYKDCFFDEKNIKVSSVRSGNVFGGGDFSEDRILPDCFRSASNNKSIKLRNPYSTRPYQHVLDPIIAYLMLLFEQENDPGICGAFNIGPDKGSDNVPNIDLVNIFAKKWDLDNKQFIEQFSPKDYKKEATFLSLDNSKIKDLINWKPLINLDLGIELTVDWYKTFLEKGNIENLMDAQINKVLSL